MHECEICEKSFVCEFDRHLHNAWIKKIRLGLIRRVLLVNSNKGGLGNTLFAALLAAKMKKMNYKVALLETSFSSSLPYYFDLPFGNGLELVPNGIIPPVSSFDYPYLSPSLFMAKDHQLVDWDKEAIIKFLKKMIINTNWGDTDILVLDLACGHLGFIDELKAFFGDRLTSSVLMLDYKQLSSPYTSAYIHYHESLTTILQVLSSPSKNNLKDKKNVADTKYKVSSLEFCDLAYFYGASPADIIKNVNELYAPVIEEVSTSCLSIF
ncbi:MAG: P-loop NTPase [bacterium]